MIYGGHQNSLTDLAEHERGVMTRAQHYAEAERLLIHTDRSVAHRYNDSEAIECARQQLAAAQVHATLATATPEVSGERS